MPQVKAVCVSPVQGPKNEVKEINLIEELGVEGDHHAKGGIRQVSLLANESIDKMKAKGLKLVNGSFGENIITEGIDLLSLNIGERLAIGETLLEISKIGKECVKRCIIYYQVGDCVMPREGIFGMVVKGGTIKAGDIIERM
ncbi:MAG: MOSC domain-containing protein [Candidatus Margulisbacteria bacterium]|nr:MOSC domain-containing protein [Candidatus Margulisiibacteriota bacterium]MBU1617831.1 MOSC domain-containing protein [Candidatus Margulisiibacteriota bacterium]